MWTYQKKDIAEGKKKIPKNEEGWDLQTKKIIIIEFERERWEKYEAKQKQKNAKKITVINESKVNKIY